MKRRAVALAVATVAFTSAAALAQTATAVSVPPGTELRATLGSRTSHPVEVTSSGAVPKIRGVVVLEEQLGRRFGPDVAATLPAFKRNTAYPFLPATTPASRAQAGNAPIAERTLFIWGESLGTPRDGGPVSLSPFVTYREETSPDLDQARKQGWWRIANVDGRASTNRELFQTAIVKATLQKGVTPGSKALLFRGVRVDWPLAFSNYKAVLRFVREGGVATYDPTFMVFPGDVAFLEIAFETDVGFDGIDLALARQRPGSTTGDPLGVVNATRLKDRAGLVLRTGPLHFREVAGSGGGEAASRAAVVAVTAGDRVSATLANPYEALLVAGGALVEVGSDPRLLGPTWANALGRVATCQKEPGRRLDAAYAGEPSTVVSRRVFTEFTGDTLALTPLGRRRTELGRRDVVLSKGDHAAAILIRDEFVRLGLLRINVGRSAARRLTTQDVLEATEWQGSILPGFLGPGQGLIDPLWTSMARAIHAGDCDLEELLVLSGQDAPAVVGSVLQRLLRRDPSAQPPRWVADRVAQAYVKDLKSVGAALRALDEYRSVDDAYKTMGLALGTAGLAAAFELAGASGLAAYAMLGGDVADAAIFGSQGVRAYFDGEDQYGYAQGATPILGSNEFLSEAEARREGALMAAAGLIAPGVGAGFGVRDLRNLQSIQRGRDLLRSTDRALDDLASFTDAQRQDLAAYYANLEERAAAGRRLDTVDEAARGRFRQYFADAGEPVAPVPAPPDPLRGSTVDPLPLQASSNGEWLDDLEIRLDSSDLRHLARDSDVGGQMPRPDLDIPLNPPAPLPDFEGSTLRHGDWNTLEALHGARLEANETLSGGGTHFLDPATHVTPSYRRPVELLDLNGKALRIDGRTYRRGDLLNPVPADPHAPSAGSFADVYSVVDESGQPAPFVVKVYGERQLWEPGSLNRQPSLDAGTAEDIEMAADIEYGAGLLERAGIPQADLVYVDHRGAHPIIVQRRLGRGMPEGIVAEETWEQAARRHKLSGSGVWLDDAMAPYRKAVLDGRRQMADQGLGWEDGHPANFFFQRVRTNQGEQVRMAIADQDRMDYVKPLADGRRPLEGRKTSGALDFLYQRWRTRTPANVRRLLDRDDPHAMAIASLWHKGAFKFDNGQPVDGWLKVSEIRETFGEHFSRLLGEAPRQEFALHGAARRAA